MPTDVKSYRVFVSVPGGMEAERRAVREATVAFSESQGLAKGAMFVTVGGEVTPGGVALPQALTNELVRESDFFMLLLHDRWRMRGEQDAAGGRASDPEEEFELATECLDRADSPMRQIAVLFRAVAPEQEREAKFHLKQVLDFKRNLPGQANVLSETFNDLSGLRDGVRSVLATWVRGLEPERGTRPGVKPRVAAEQKTGYPLALDESGVAPAIARAELLEEAKRLADSGRTAGAEACFALAVARGDDPGAFIEYGRFLRRVGRPVQAGEMFERAIKYAAQTDDPATLASAYSNMGLLLQVRGDLANAEQMHRKALEITRMRGDQQGVAGAYSNIGSILKARGDLPKAEVMLRKALAIEEKNGRMRGIANQYCNLGLISRRLGDLTRAEDMLRRALAIDEKLGRFESMANQYGNIGLVLKARGNLDDAEVMLRKALAINENLGRLEGMASDYGNLGLIFQARGQLAEAERMHLTSLAMEEQVGRLEGMARTHHSLGQIAHSRHEQQRAREHWTRARDLFAQIGMPMDVRIMDGLLAELGEERHGHAGSDAGRA